VFVFGAPGDPEEEKNEEKLGLGQIITTKVKV